MKEVEKDCFSCGQSMVTEEDELFCMVHQRIVKDNEACEDYS